MTTRKHVHKYKRTNLSRKNNTEPFIVLACQDKCTHYVQQALAVGRECVCWRCGRTFTLDIVSVKLARPHCLDCKVVNSVAKAKIDKVEAKFDVDKLLQDLEVK